jgi:hypothetical protein
MKADRIKINGYDFVIKEISMIKMTSERTMIDITIDDEHFRNVLDIKEIEAGKKECRDKLTDLRERLRAGAECAPWVIEEIDKILGE